MKTLIILAYAPDKYIDLLQTEMKTAGSFDHVLLSYAGCRARNAYPACSPSAIAKRAKGDVTVLPLFMTDGAVYSAAKAEIDASVRAAHRAPLLENKKSIDGFASALRTVCIDNAATGCIWVGHGSHARENSGYAELQAQLGAHTKIALLHGKPDIREALQTLETPSVSLFPLMFTAGHHVRKDICAADSPVMQALQATGKPFALSKRGLLAYGEFRAYLRMRNA
ncbi:MAG: sirohydrochlorin cobaltochelatase [Clostridia bacterium]|nr:sirohydrochlorin cobaltochelatase [Clostridia bacterium]